MTIQKTPQWQAKGLLFENCNCQLICPAHISFKQNCTNERCTGYWAVRFDEGEYEGIPLSGLCALILFETPQRMYEGGWTEALYLDKSADPRQLEALETIIKGKAGGPWEILARFVGTWLETQTVDFDFKDEGARKRLKVSGLFETEIEALRGANPGTSATLENLHNVIHGPTHTLARGVSRCSDQGFNISTDGSHALFSNFSWKSG